MQVWLNGQIVEHEKARIHPFDRGFLFGDGVYEVVAYFNRVGVGMAGHIARLDNSLKAARIGGFDAAAIEAIGANLLASNGLVDALFYVQVTRGVEVPRKHLPGADMEPTVFAFATPAPALSELQGPQPRMAITVDDQRWHRCEVKCISLMANVIVRLEADDAGAEEAILIRDGFVSEGTATNVFTIHGERVRTPPIGVQPSILAGITRHMVLEVAEELGLAAASEPIGASELRDADEIFISSTRRLIDGIVELDGRKVSDGAVGDRTRALFDAVRIRVGETCGVALHSCS